MSHNIIVEYKGSSCVVRSCLSANGQVGHSPYSVLPPLISVNSKIDANTNIILIIFSSRSLLHNSARV